MLKKCKIYLKLGEFAPFYSKIILKKGKKYCKIKTHILYCGTSPSSSNVATPSFDGDRCYTECKSKKEYKNDNTSYEVSKGVKEGMYMDKTLNVANYILQLYFKCGEKYKCKGTKLEKLLSIAKMISIINDRLLFSDDIIAKSCGTGIDYDFPADLCGDIFYGSVEECNKPIDGSELTKSCVENLRFSVSTGSLSESEEKLLIDVYLNFGNYSGLALGELINEFKDKVVSVDGDKGRKVLDEEKLRKFFDDITLKESENAIVSFIAGYEIAR